MYLYIYVYTCSLLHRGVMHDCSHRSLTLASIKLIRCRQAGGAEELVHVPYNFIYCIYIYSFICFLLCMIYYLYNINNYIYTFIHIDNYILYVQNVYIWPIHISPTSSNHFQDDLSQPPSMLPRIVSSNIPNANNQVMFTNFHAIPWIFIKNSPFILIKFLAEPSWA